MNTFSVAVIAGIVLLSSYNAVAAPAHEESLQSQRVEQSSADAGKTPDARKVLMQACFRKHMSLMQKPALMNVYRCWSAHDYLMEGMERAG